MMENVTCSETAKHNLLSLTSRIKKGWILNGTKDSLILTKEGKKVVFDVKIHTPKGILFCIRIKRRDANEVAMDAIDDNESKLILSRTGIKTAHEMLSHMGEVNECYGNKGN